MTRTPTALAWLLGWLVVALGFAVSAGAQTSPAPYDTAYRYQDGGLLTGKISPAASGQGNFLATRNTYDANLRLQTVETGYLAAWPDSVAGYTPVAPSDWGLYTSFSISRTVSYAYDAFGRKVKETVRGSDGAATQVTQYSYDPYGRLLCTAVRMNPAVFNSAFPDACTPGPANSEPDRITMNEYDSLNRVIQVKKGLFTSDQEAYATYSYTADGLLEYIVDPRGNRSKQTYDAYDRLNGLYFPSPSPPTGFNSADAAHALATAGAASSTDFESYGLDNNGNRTSLKTRDGQTISYQIDALNRVWRKDVPGATGSVYYGYDLRGLQTYARFGSNLGLGISNAYDGFGRRLSTTNTMGGSSLTVSRLYDADGDLTRVTHPDQNYFQYTYDGADRFTGILENGTTSVVSQDYFPNGLRSSQSRGAVATSYGYQPNMLLASITDTLAGTASLTTNFAYNSANQLTSRARSNDAYAFTGSSVGSTGYAVDGLNRYTNVGGAVFNYDGRGNLTSDGTNTYTYDVENRLITASGGYKLTYDPLGRLFQIVGDKQTTQFLYDGDAMVYEIDTIRIGLSPITGIYRFVHGPQVDSPLISYAGYPGTPLSPSQRRSLQVDHQGSVVSLADASGNAQAINTYDEYGAPGSGNTGRFQYTGQIWLSELGLYYYKARVYAPRLGRFLQTDPVGYKDDLNLYAYVGNDPLNRTDPSGLWTCDMQHNETSCLQIATGLGRAHAAEEKMKDGKERTKLQEVLKLWGKYGDKGINVQFASSLSDPAAAANTVLAKDGTSVDMTFNTGTLGTMTANQRAAIIAHEGQHGVDTLAVAKTRNLATLRSAGFISSTELSAYRLQSYVDEALGSKSFLWSPGMSDKVREGRIYSNASESFVSDCAAWGPGCTYP